MSTPIVREDVAGYVAAVRVHLDDLSAEEVDELTGGLEADLDDALDEAVAAGRTPAEQFGPPATYAAELRAAAGLPPRAEEGGRRGAAARMGAGLQGRWDRLSDRATRDPRWPAVRDFLVEIRPAWWVIRAVVAALLLREVFSTQGFLTLVLLVVAVIVSVEWGRRRLAARGWPWRLGIRAGNVLAVLLIPVIWGGLASSPSPEYAGVYSVPPENGVWVDGVEVRNIFPYDDQGRPLSGVQLYDENGRPVQVGESARTPVDVNGTMIGQVPAVDGAGAQHWNVFPLRQQAQLYGDGGELRPDPAGPTPATPPTVTPGPLLVGGASPAPAPSPTVSPSAGPTGTASPSAGPVGTVSPSAGPTPTLTPVPTLSPLPTASTG